MKLIKANTALQSEEDRARDARLTAIASRYRVIDTKTEDLETSDPLQTPNEVQ